MTIEEAIAQLKDLRKDRETFLANDEPDSEFAKDIAAIDVTVKALEETAELKRLLRLAVEDMKTITINVAFEGLVCGGECARFFECERVKNNDEKIYRCCKFEWKHAEEALKLIGGDK